MPRLPIRRRKTRHTRPTLDDHRAFVGGMWETIGPLQFDFMVAQGLRPEHVLLDVACGALRGGVHFIRYLEPGNYLGLDRERTLIDSGLEHELGADVAREKRPEFVISGGFEFERFSKRPDYSLAQSLFSHLVPRDIQLCLLKLRAFVELGHSFYATFNEGPSDANPAVSDPHDYYAYEVDELSSFGGDAGWRAEYIGEWNHPRDQKMMRFVAV